MTTTVFLRWLFR